MKGQDRNGHHGNYRHRSAGRIRGSDALLGDAKVKTQDARRTVTDNGPRKDNNIPIIVQVPNSSYGPALSVQKDYRRAGEH